MVYVALISYIPDPERTIAVARVSTSAAGASALVEKLTPEAVSRLIDRLISAGRLSPPEHASFTFAIEGISRGTRHQPVRHRMASYTQQNQRCVSLREFNYIAPVTIRARGELEAIAAKKELK